MELKRLKKTVRVNQSMSHYDFDGQEFEAGIKYLRKAKRQAMKKLKMLGATSNIMIRYVAENDDFYGDPSFEFSLQCSGSRMETDEEMRIRNRTNARAAETRALKKVKVEEQEKALLIQLKAKYE